MLTRVTFRLNRQAHYKPMSVEMPSPVDSGIGQEIMVTPKHEPGHDVVSVVCEIWHLSIVTCAGGYK